MIDKDLKIIKEKIDAIKEAGHGEVVVKIKNGVIYRVLQTYDKLITKP